MVNLIGLMADFLSFGMGLASYVLLSLALYTIAKRRGIHKPWTAWVPVANIWLLGCISDQYRQVARGQVKSKRKAMLTLMIIMLVLVVIVVGLTVSLVLDVLPYLPKQLLDINEWQKMASMDETALTEYLMDMLEGAAVLSPAVENAVLVKAMILTFLALGLSGVSIALTVLEYMAYHDVFVSADPRSATTYFVIGLVAGLMGLGLLMAIFVFLNRNKDMGMPPRGGRMVDAIPSWIPPQQM